MKKHSTMLWITGLALGWLFDLLFWKQPFGINFALYAALCVAGGVLVLRRNGQDPARGTLLLFPLILIFAAVSAWRAEPLTMSLAFLFTLLLLFLLAASYLGGQWLRYGVEEYVASGVRLIGSMVYRPMALSIEMRKERLGSGSPSRGQQVWPVVRGLAIAVPVVAIFAGLLASADAAFSSGLETVLKYFAIENLPEYIFRMVYILVGAYALVGVILHASTQSADERSTEGKRTVPAFLGFTESAIVLGSVAVLFATFVVVQFRYFFGGQANIHVAGFTYAEYARRGFGELVAVAFFSLLMIMVLEAVTRRESGVQRRVFSGLSVAIVILVMVMLVSAYQRLALYESAYGFSRLRMYTHVALIWIALLLAAVVTLEILERQRLFTLAVLIASLGFALSLALVNVDGAIVAQNVRRAQAGHELDVAYLFSLSADSIPALVEAYQDPSAPKTVREAAGAALFCRINEPHTTRLPRDWRSFSIAQWQAGLALDRVKGSLAGYRLVSADWPMQLRTPSGAMYNCYSGAMD